jgi:hypothetical protein
VLAALPRSVLLEHALHGRPQSGCNLGRRRSRLLVQGLDDQGAYHGRIAQRRPQLRDLAL